MSWNYRDYCTFELTHFNAVQAETSQHVFARMKFQQESMKKKKIAEMAWELAETGSITDKLDGYFKLVEKLMKLNIFVIYAEITAKANEPLN